VSTVNQSEEHQEATERLSDPDPFALPRLLKKRLRCCSQASCTPSDNVVYLWVDWTASAAPSKAAGDAPRTLALQDWLNIIDEAATLGVSWAVFSVDAAPSAMPHIWEVARWAQTTHGMTTAFHSRSGEIPPQDLAAIQELDTGLVCIFAARDQMPRMVHLREAGLQLHVADPEDGDRHHTCLMPGNMIFVNPEGVLYTCGMVKHNNDFRLGHVYDKKLNHVVHDPSLPHAVPEDAANDETACHGCPPLVAKHAGSPGGAGHSKV